MKTLTVATTDEASLVSLIKWAYCAMRVIIVGEQPKADVTKTVAWVRQAAPMLKTWMVARDYKIITKLLADAPNYTDSDNLDYDLLLEATTLIREYLPEEQGTHLSLSLQFKLLDALCRVIKSQNENQYKTLLTKISILGDLSFARMFSPKIGSAKSVTTGYANTKKELESIVQRFTTRKNAHSMTTEEKNKLKAKNPDQYERYVALTKSLSDYYRNALQSYIRSSGKQYAPTKDVIKYLEGMGIVHSIPKAFVGNIDDASKYYDIEGELLNGTPFGEVIMNPAWKDDHAAYYCTYQRPGTPTLNKLYRLSVVKERKAQRFSLVNNTVAKLDRYRAKWVKDLKSKTDKAIPALLCEIGYEVSPRVGSEGNSTKVNGRNIKTYGLTTIQVKCIKFTGTKCTITYLGKKGGKQIHVIPGLEPIQKIVISKLRELCANKSPTDAVFTDSDGNAVGGRDVNEYMKSLGMPVKFHSFRKIKATEIMTDWLANFEIRNPTSKEVNDYVKEGCEEIGRALGHFSGEKVTGATALNAYLDPGILAAFYQLNKAVPTDTILKAINSALED